MLRSPFSILLLHKVALGGRFHALSDEISTVVKTFGDFPARLEDYLEMNQREAHVIDVHDFVGSL